MISCQRIAQENFRIRKWIAREQETLNENLHGVLCCERERVEYGAVIKKALAQHRRNEIVGMAGYVYNTQKQYHMVVGLLYGVLLLKISNRRRRWRRRTSLFDHSTSVVSVGGWMMEAQNQVSGGSGAMTMRTRRNGLLRSVIK